MTPPVRVCEREREREIACVRECVSVCVREREREIVCVRECVSVCERDRCVVCVTV